MQNRNCILIYFKTEAWTQEDFEATKNHIVAEGFISQNMTKTSRSKKQIQVANSIFMWILTSGDA